MVKSVGVLAALGLAFVACPPAWCSNPPSVVYVTAADLDNTSSSPAVVAADGLNKWFMYNDTNDTVDNTLGSFVTGPGNPPLGTGSVQFTLGANPLDRKNIATYRFSGMTLASITQMSFAVYSHSGVAGATESPFLNFNADFTGTSTAFQKRLVYVPSDNGPVPQDTWNTFDVINGGNAMWRYSGANWPVASTGPDNGLIVSGNTPRKWSAILADYPGIRILVGDSWLGIRVGEPGPTNYQGNVENFVIGTASGTTEYVFEPTAPSVVYVTAADLDNTSSNPGVVATDGLNKWFMYNDTNDTVDNTLGSFVNGPGTPPLGTGSVQFTLAASPLDRKNIATYRFSGTPLASIIQMSFAAYSHSGVAGATESPFLNFNVDFTGSSTTFQKRLVFVPSDNGPVPQDTWNTFDVINGGNALWRYSGATWPVASAGPDNGLSGVSGNIPRKWSAILADYPGIRILVGDSWLGIRVGEPGPANYTGNINNFVIGTASGATEYVFELTAPTNVSGQVNVTQPGFVRNRATGRWSTTLTVTNKSNGTINGPIQVVLTSLSSNAALLNASGTSNGSPYITVTGASLAPGASASMVITFSNSNNGFISFTPVTYSGPVP